MIDCASRGHNWAQRSTHVNERVVESETAENNSAVLFWEAVGPADIMAVYRDQYFKLLEMPRPPEKGDYFIPLDTFIGRMRAESSGDASRRAKELDAALESKGRGAPF